MAEKKLSAVIQIGGVVSASLKNALGKARAGLGGVGGELGKLTSRQKELNDTLRRQASLGKQANMATIGYATAELRQIEKQIGLLKKKNRLIDKAREGMQRGRDMMASGAKMAGMAGGAIVGALALPVKNAAEQETAALGIAKYFDGMRDEAGKLTDDYHRLVGEIQALGRVTPIATNELFAMAAAAGQSGVGKGELIQFLRDNVMMVSAFELSAQQVGDDMGKIAGVYNIPIDKLSGLGDVMNYVADNTKAKVPEIIGGLKRIGGVAAAVNMNEKDAVGLLGTMLTLGSTEETASTAINAIISKLAAATANKKVAATLKTKLKLDPKKIQEGMVKDAMGTMLKVFDALGKVAEKDRIAVTGNLFGAEHGDDASKLAARIDLLRDYVALAHSDKAVGSMKREYDAGNDTAEKKFQLLKNAMEDVSVTVGKMLLPVLGDLAKVTGTALAAVSDFIKENQTLVKGVGAAVLAFGGAVTALGTVKLAIGAATLAWNVLKLAFAANPLGLAISLLAAAAAAVYTNWEPIKWFWGEMCEGFSSAFKGAVEWVSNAWDTLSKNISAGIDWIMGKLEPMISAFKGGIEWVGDKFGAVSSARQAAVDWTSEKMGSVSGFFGGLFGDKKEPKQAATPVGRAVQALSAAPPVPSPAPALPPVPAPAARGAVNQSNAVTINVTQQPGQDGRALAREIVAAQERATAARRRGMMIDMAGAY